jgi:hypothetical protein
MAELLLAFGDFRPRTFALEFDPTRFAALFCPLYVVVR